MTSRLSFRLIYSFIKAFCIFPRRRQSLSVKLTGCWAYNTKGVKSRKRVCLLIVSDVIDKFPTAERIRIVLFRNESRSLGFSVIIDVRKSTAKRKYLENIVEAMVCFQVCKKSLKIVVFASVKGTLPDYLIFCHSECLFIITR